MDLVAPMSSMHDTNPATRTIEPLLAYLRTCDELKYVEIYGIVHACQESPTVLASHYSKVMLALLEHIVRPCMM